MDTDVLIAGAGPTGLVLACDLARRGLDCRVVERSERGFPGTRGVAIQPRSQEVLADLGVLDTIRSIGGPCQPVRIWEGTEPIGETELIERVDPTPDRPYGEPLMLAQWHTVNILGAKFEELGGHVAFQSELTGFTQDADGVTATLADGSTVRSRYLVGADGGRSRVRQALDVGFEITELDDRSALIADVVLGGLSREHWNIWPFAEDGRFMLVATQGAETFRLIAAFADPDTELDTARDATPQALQQLARHRTGLPDLTITDVTWASVFQARAAVADRFRRGRVLIAGDAAHIHSPAGGQGLNTGVQDAYNLGWKLEAVLQDDAAGASLLDSYAAERMPVAAEVIRHSTRIMAADEGAQARLTRRGADTHQLSLSYRDSPVVQEQRGGLTEQALHAGDRAPDAPCQDSAGAAVRLFDVFAGPHSTLLAFGDVEPPEVGGPVRTYRIGTDLIDAHGHARAAYADHGLFLIRPDGYVGVATHDPAGITDHLWRAVPSSAIKDLSGSA